MRRTLQRRHEALDVTLTAALVDASLLPQTEARGEARFAMLETIREFGREHVEECGEVNEVARKHAAYYLAFTDQTGPETLPSDPNAALDRIAPTTTFSAWVAALARTVAG